MCKFSRGLIKELDENEVIVYGSNGKGANGGGLARLAEEKGWTEAGHVEGLAPTGKAFAVNTMDGDMKFIDGLLALLLFAEQNPEKTILLTPIGLGIAGYVRSEVDDLLQEAANACDRVILPLNIVKVGW